MRTRALFAVIAGVTLLLLAGSAGAGTWKVGRLANDCDGPCDFYDTFPPGSTPGGGIDVALSSVSVVSGDTVLVWPGAKTGVSFPNYVIRTQMKSGVTLIAFGYPDSTVIIEGFAGAQPAVQMNSTSELTRVLGFTFRWDAGSTGLGGGIAAFTSAGTIRDNRFVDCSAGIGAGVYLQSCTLTLTNNVFIDDVCVAGGGVIAVSGGSPTISNNTVYRASAPLGTDGSAVFATGTTMTLEKNIIVGSLGASAIFCGGGNVPVISCNLLYANQLGAFGGQCPDSTGTSGNFVADPMFCGIAGPDSLGLCAGSPAMQAPSCGPIGFQSPLGGCVGCSVPTPVLVNFQDITWGRLKATYR